MVGAARRLATELVVIIASATQEIHWVVATRVRAEGTARAPAAGTSAAVMTFPAATRSPWGLLRHGPGGPRPRVWSAGTPGASPLTGDMRGRVTGVSPGTATWTGHRPIQRSGGRARCC